MKIKKRNELMKRPLPDFAMGIVFDGTIYCPKCNYQEDHIIKNKESYIEVVKEISCPACGAQE